MAASRLARNIALPALVCGAILAADAAKPANDKTKVDFVVQIQPILRKHCYSCHGQEVQEAGLRLDLKPNALVGGDDGKVIIPGSASESRLAALIAGDDPDGRIMPPKDDGVPLSKAEVSLIRAWIDAGAVWPEGADPVAKQEADLWSFASSCQFSLGDELSRVISQGGCLS